MKGRSWAKRIDLLLFFFLLKGCVTIPSIKEEGTFKSAYFAPQVLQDPLLKESGAVTEKKVVLQEWWKQFADKQLEHLVAKALQENPSLKVMVPKLKQVEQIAKGTKSFLFPNLHLDFQTNWQSFGENTFFRAIYPHFPKALDQINLQGRFSYDVDIWGKYRHQFYAALGKVQAQRAELKQTELIATTSTVESYISLQAYFQREEKLEKLVTVLEKLQDLTKARKSAGLDTQLQEEAIQVSLDEVKILYIRNEKNKEKAGYQIACLIGGYPGEESLCRVEPFHIEKIALPQDLPLDLIVKRPDLQAALARAESAAHMVGVAKADFYPNINLAAIGGLETLKIDTLLSPQSHLTSLLPSLHLPLFTGGRLTANLKEKYALFEESIALYNEVILIACKQVADSLASWKWAVQEMQRQDISLQSSQALVDLHRARFDHALDTEMDRLTAEKNLLIQQIQWIDLWQVKLMAYVSLIYALGGGVYAS